MNPYNPKVYSHEAFSNTPPDSTCKCNGWFRVGLF